MTVEPRSCRHVAQPKALAMQKRKPTMGTRPADVHATHCRESGAITSKSRQSRKRHLRADIALLGGGELMRTSPVIRLGDLHTYRARRMTTPHPIVFLL